MKRVKEGWDGEGPDARVDGVLRVQACLVLDKGALAARSPRHFTWPDWTPRHRCLCMTPVAAYAPLGRDLHCYDNVLAPSTQKHTERCTQATTSHPSERVMGYVQELSGKPWTARELTCSNFRAFNSVLREDFKLQGTAARRLRLDNMSRPRHRNTNPTFLKLIYSIPVDLLQPLRKPLNPTSKGHQVLP